MPVGVCCLYLVSCSQVMRAESPVVLLLSKMLLLWFCPVVCWWLSMECISVCGDLCVTVGRLSVGRMAGWLDMLLDYCISCQYCCYPILLPLLPLQPRPAASAVLFHNSAVCSSLRHLGRDCPMVSSRFCGDVRGTYHISPMLRPEC